MGVCVHACVCVCVSVCVRVFYCALLVVSLLFCFLLSGHLVPPMGRLCTVLLPGPSLLYGVCNDIFFLIA